MWQELIKKGTHDRAAIVFLGDAIQYFASLNKRLKTLRCCFLLLLVMGNGCDRAVCTWDPSGKFAAIVNGGVWVNEQEPLPLVLTDQQHQLEHLMAYGIAVEFVRVAAPPSPSVTATYAKSGGR